MYRGTAGKEQDSIIGFYNKVYMVAMKSIILLFAPNKVRQLIVQLNHISSHWLLWTLFFYTQNGKCLFPWNFHVREYTKLVIFSSVSVLISHMTYAHGNKLTCWLQFACVQRSDWIIRIPTPPMFLRGFIIKNGQEEHALYRVIVLKVLSFSL